ncbi:MAG: superoxide dismutase family protein [Pirellulales bacterium]
MKTTLSTLLAGMVLLGVCSLNAQQPQPKKQTPKTTTKKTTDHAHDHDHAHHPLPQNAVCVLMPTKDQEVQGTVMFTQRGGSTQIIGEVRGLTPGKHGFHIHEFGDLRSDDGTSAGGHYNPEGHPHGGLDDAKRHVGDLGNITADQSGNAMIKMTVKGLQVHFILGRGLVVHAKEDDLKTQPTGDAGGRVAVGVIGVATEKSAGSTTTTPTGAGTKKTKS